MDKEIKAKWLAALRSGEYEQGRSYLCRDGKYCCLGVLAKRAEWLDADGRVEGLSGFLPRAREIEIGLPAYDTDHLIGMNDSGKSFAEIADWIEANL